MLVLKTNNILIIVSDSEDGRMDPSPIHKSNPDVSRHPRLEPSYMHTKVVRRQRRRTISIMRPLDRPDSLFTSSLHLLPTLDRSISSLHVNISKHNQIREDAPYLSTISLQGSIDRDFGDEKAVKSSKSSWQRIVDLLDLTLFRKGAFIIFTVASITLQLGYFVPFVYFYTFVLEAGLTKEDALMMIMVLGILHTFGRLLGGVLANIPCVDIVLLMGVSFLLCGASHFSLPFLPHNLIALSAYAGAYGFFSGVSIVLFI